MDEQQAGSSSNINVNEILNEAEGRFREGLDALNRWGVQARDIIRDRPGAVLAGVAAAGFVAGLLLRRGSSDRQS